MLRASFKSMIREHFHRQKSITPEKEDKNYFVETVIFLVFMIITIALIVYMGVTLFHSNLESVPTQLTP
jgi:hypothetical protein